MEILSAQFPKALIIVKQRKIVSLAEEVKFWLTGTYIKLTLNSFPFFIPYIKGGQIQENKVMSKTGLKHKLAEFVLRLIYILLAFQSPESDKFTRMWFLVLRTMATWSHNCGLVKFPGFIWHEVALLLTCIN